MTAFALLFVASVVVLAIAVWRSERLLARAAAAACVVSYAAFFTLLIVGGIRG